MNGPSDGGIRVADRVTRILNGSPMVFDVPEGFSDLKTVEVFCDETGDRGWSADSSPWFGMCAVMVPQEAIPQMRATLAGLRHEINTDKPLHWVEHFQKAKQGPRRQMAALMLAALPGVKVIYVVADKATLKASPRLRESTDLFYHYTMRLLLERVAQQLASWGRREAEGGDQIGCGEGDASRGERGVSECCSYGTAAVFTEYSVGALLLAATLGRDQRV